MVGQPGEDPAGPGGVEIQQALVAAAPEAKADVLQFLHIAAVHQDVDEGEELVRHLAAGVGALGVELLPGEAGEGPDVLLRQLLAEPAEEREEGALVLGLEGLAPQQGQSPDVAGGEQPQELRLRLRRATTSNV